MPEYSHLTSSTAALLDVIADAVTGGSYSPLTTSRAQLLAIIANDIDGTSLSHLTTSEEALWRAVVVALDGEGFSFDENAMGINEYLANVATNIGEGVTNTAPHDIVIAWQDFDPDGSEGTYSEAAFAELDVLPNNDNTRTIAGFTVTDDEGNPLRISIPDDGGILAPIPDEDAWGGSTVVVNRQLSAGEYDFTVRFTDPGGLYVEQEFTITVTA